MTLLDEMAVIGLGANLGQPLETLGQALKRLYQASELSLVVVSSVYLTEPQGGPSGQNWYHNAVAFFRCCLEPRPLLELLLDIEKSLGRERLERWGPRVIDLDLLALGRRIVDQAPDLIVPHPRMTERLFVMAPLAETAPDWRHPIGGKTAASLLAAIDQTGQGIKRTSFRL